MAMSRKDYELIADAIRDVIEDHKGDLTSADAVARKIADALSRDNPRFDSKRFITACGL